MVQALILIIAESVMAPDLIKHGVNEREISPHTIVWLVQVVCHINAIIVQMALLMLLQMS